MSMAKLKIGLDYHGVVDKKPEYFARFCAEAQRRGHKIYIITGGPRIKIKKILQEEGIYPDFIFAISDYYQALGMIKQSQDGGFVIPANLWDIAKAWFCRRNQINFHIDDSIEYMHWFSTPFCLYDSQGDVCYLSPGIMLNFSQPPAAILDTLEQTLSKLSPSAIDS